MISAMAYDISGFDSDNSSYIIIPSWHIISWYIIAIHNIFPYQVIVSPVKTRLLYPLWCLSPPPALATSSRLVRSFSCRSQFACSNGGDGGFAFAPCDVRYLLNLARYHSTWYQLVSCLSRVQRVVEFWAWEIP